MNKTVVMQSGGAPPAAPSPQGSRGLQPPPGPPPQPSVFARAGGATRVGMRLPGPHPLMGPMYWAAADVLALASQLSQGALPSSASQLRTNLADLFAELRSKGAAAGIVPEDLNDAIYAVMALLDEILVQANWPGRAEWQASPLQFEHYQENTAGENFFRRAETYSQQPHRAHVLQIYFVCLSLGFQGRYAMGQVTELEALQRKVSASVSLATIPSDVLSPHGVPADAGQSFLKREAPVARVGLACLGAALLIFLILLLLRTVQLSHAVTPMRAYGGAALATPGKP